MVLGNLLRSIRSGWGSLVRHFRSQWTGIAMKQAKTNTFLSDAVCGSDMLMSLKYERTCLSYLNPAK